MTANSRRNEVNVLNCDTFSEEELQAIFRKFWADMVWNERKTYVSFPLHSVDVEIPRN